MMMMTMITVSENDDADDVCDDHGAGAGAGGGGGGGGGGDGIVRTVARF